LRFENINKNLYLVTTLIIILINENKINIKSKIPSIFKIVFGFDRSGVITVAIKIGAVITNSNICTTEFLTKLMKCFFMFYNLNKISKMYLPSQILKNMFLVVFKLLVI
jgi:hypothetical protein